LLQRGYDGAKRLSGRKRFMIRWDCGSKWWCYPPVVVLPASVPDRAGAQEIFWRLASHQVRVSQEKVWADGGFAGKEWQEQMQQQFGWQIEIVKRSDEVQGFEVLPQR
jgi:hypothetical protein